MNTRINAATFFLIAICLVTFTLAQEKPAEPSSNPASPPVTVDPTPCPWSFLYQFGNLYYYSTVECVGSPCAPSSSDVIKGYTSPVTMGCANTSPCSCVNTKPAAITLSRKITAIDPISVDTVPKQPANASPVFPRNKSSLQIGLQYDCLAKVVDGGVTTYYRCFCISYRTMVPHLPPKTVSKFVAIPLDGPPNLDIINEGVDVPIEIKTGTKTDAGEFSYIDANSHRYSIGN